MDVYEHALGTLRCRVIGHGMNAQVSVSVLSYMIVLRRGQSSYY